MEEATPSTERPSSIPVSVPLGAGLPSNMRDYRYYPSGAEYTAATREDFGTRVRRPVAETLKGVSPLNRPKAKETRGEDPDTSKDAEPGSLEHSSSEEGSDPDSALVEYKRRGRTVSSGSGPKEAKKRDRTEEDQDGHAGPGDTNHL